MKTQDIGELVGEVLNTIPKPWPEDIIDRVCLAIEHNPRWLNRYNQLVDTHGKPTVNTRIGRYAREITDLENSGERRKARSLLIKTYTRLVHSS